MVMLLKPQLAFECAVSREPKDAYFEALETVARAVWYQGYTPDVCTISNEHQIRVSCYVLDRLARFNYVCNEHYDELELLPQDLEIQMSPIATSSIEHVSRAAYR